MLSVRDNSKPRFRPLDPEQHIDIANRVCAMRYETSEAPLALLSGCQIGPVSLARYESHGLEHGVRTLEHVRANDLDYFILCLPLQARFQFLHAGLRSDFCQGEAVLLSSQRPFDAYISSAGADDARHTSLQVRVPGALLRARVAQVDQLCNRTFSVGSGGGAVLRATLLALQQEAAQMMPGQAQHHGLAVADMIAGCIEGLGEAQAVPSRVAVSGDILFQRAMAYIECHLSTGDLNAERVAEHCRVSPRYLRTIFAQRALSVSGYIRDARLQCCRRALNDPRMMGQSIIEIACRWGFSDPSHFGRLYRKSFGRSPSEERASKDSPALN